MNPVPQATHYRPITIVKDQFGMSKKLIETIVEDRSYYLQLVSSSG